MGEGHAGLFSALLRIRMRGEGRQGWSGDRGHGSNRMTVAHAVLFRAFIDSTLLPSFSSVHFNLVLLK